MGSLPQTPASSTNSHLYPQALQLKLYQAFIFSIPILFSIILFLLFYLFYLKRRASTLSSSPPILPRSYQDQSAATTDHVSSDCPVGLKGELKEKLQTILFDEEQRKKDAQCCVCLGDFEMEEELLQVISCRHVFHVDCIHHWLHNNTTCPLCRCSVIPISTKLDSPALQALPSVSSPGQHNPSIIVSNHSPVSSPGQHNPSIIVSNHSPGIILLDQQHQQQHQLVSNVTSNVTTPVEGSSSEGGGAILRDSGMSTGHYTNEDLREPVVVCIQTHDLS